MKLTGWAAVACAAFLVVGCDRNRAADTDNDGVGRIGTSESSRDDTIGTSGQVQADHSTAGHGATAGARHFATTAVMAGNAEVKLGQMASTRAQSPEVKQFAEMMVRDHSKSGAELKQAIRAHDVDAPEGVDDKHQRLMDRLGKLSGAEFDREYMKAMVDGHTEVKSMLEDRTEHSRPTGTSGAANTQLDTAVNQWATKALPTVEQHLQKAQQVRNKLNAK
jgi:putative membrane protein